MRDALRRIPRAGWTVFIIALVNAAIWTVVVPPFEVPDEITHFGYAQYLAQTGQPPPQNPNAAQYSPQEQAAIDKTYLNFVGGHADVRGVLTRADDRALHAALAHASPNGPGGATNASNQPPLYYALEAIPYWLTPSHDLLTRLVFMRLLSALLAAGTVLVVFLFLRELFPGTPWAWTVGALMVAFQPMVNDIAAGVQGDNLLYFTSALTFLLLLRAYRRGLSSRGAVGIGAAVAAGTLSKLTYIGLLPGVALAVALLGWRALPEGRRQALRLVALTAGVAAAPLVLYAVLNVAVWHRAGGVTGGGLSNATKGPVPLSESLSYIWQLYLPKLPFVHTSYFPGWPLGYLWLDGSVGRFGWLDYGFPHWVYTAGRITFAVLVVLALIGLVRVRAGWRALWPIFACFAVMAVGLMGSIGYAGIRYRLSTGFGFEQARYLFPLLVLYGLFAVLVTRAGGRRWGPVLGAVLVLLAMAHGLFAETLTISRYYG